jgi:hypothetical protein
MRRIAGAFLVVLFGLLLSGCSGGGTQPFAKIDGSPSGKTVPPIYLSTVAGLPGSKLQSLEDALAASAGKRDMAIVEGKLEEEGFNLSGNFQILPEPQALRLTYNWTLTDKAGTVLHTISAEEAVPGTADPDPWSLVTPAVLQRVAAYTAESLSSRLAQMGYATQVGGLPPPLENYAAAGPEAEHDIDYETLYGPGRTAPVIVAANAELHSARLASAKSPREVSPHVIPAVADQPVAMTEVAAKRQGAAEIEQPSNDDETNSRAEPSLDPPSDFAVAKADLQAPAKGNFQASLAADRSQSELAGSGKADFVSPAMRNSEPTPAAEHATTKTVQPPAPAKKPGAEKIASLEKPARSKINAVAVLPVRGAPGNGNAELTKALRDTLSAAGWPVVAKSGANALTVTGKVRIAPTQGNSQKVILAWTVLSPEGRTLGTVDQANDVPAGSLDQAWGQTAVDAAQGAATGLFDLVKKLR